MQVAGAEIERVGAMLIGPRPPTEAVARLQQRHGYPRAGQCPRGGHAGGAGSDDRNVVILHTKRVLIFVMGRMWRTHQARRGQR
jgi:hypothetical protein